jgi:methylmalonyl-CoA/ethylmalonyl-CoA epimerase
MDTSSTTFGLSAIGQVAVTIKDLPRAIKFYRDVLGVPMLLETPAMAFFQAGDIRLMIGMSEGVQGANLSSLIYFKVDDIQAACQELEPRGVLFTHEPRLVHRGQKADLWLAFFNDPDGNVLALMSEVPRRD